MQLIYVFIYTMLMMFLFTNKVKIKSIAMSLINVFIIVLTNYLLFREFIVQFNLYIFLLTTFLALPLFLFIKKEVVRFHFIYICFCVISISVLSELFIFNFRHFESFNYKNLSFKIQADELLYKNDDNTYVAPSDGTYYFYLTNIGSTVKNIQIDLENILNHSKVQEVTIFATDEANENYFELPSFYTNHEISRSCYHRLHLSGKTEKLKIAVPLSKDETISILQLNLNVNVPFFFSFVRVFSVAIFLFLLYLLRPNSKFYKISLFSKKSKLIICLYFIFQVFIFWYLVNLNPIFKNAPFENQHQYEKLAEAFSNGHLYLSDPVSDTLKNMKNPYDSDKRSELMNQSGDTFMWDHAYYNGKYYVYFGVLPVLVAYYPYYIVTNSHLSNYIVNFIMCSLTALSMLMLMYQICKKYFQKTPLIIYLLLSTLLVYSSGLLYIAKRPDFYFIPIIFSLFLVMTGLSLWISSLNCTKNSNLKMSLGSLSMALVALARPQFLVVSFLIFPLFYEKIISEKKDRIKNILLLIVPYLVVAIFAMAYNYLRFGSVLDFGANYNLTTNDMTKRGFVFDRTFLGIICYLFLPTTINTVFPFIKGATISTNYLGRTISETFFGGFIYNNLICLIGLFVFKFKKYFSDKKLYYFCLICTLLSFVVIVADTQMAGILPRYICDFGYLLLISTNIIILSLYSKLNKNKKIILIKILLLGVFLSLLYQFFFIFCDVSESLDIFNPNFYYKILYLFQFLS